MARHRIYSIDFVRQVAQEFLGGEALNGLTAPVDRAGLSRSLLNVGSKRSSR